LVSLGPLSLIEPHANLLHLQNQSPIASPPQTTRASYSQPAGEKGRRGNRSAQPRRRPVSYRHANS
jgi:hypothetical protein